MKQSSSKPTSQQLALPFDEMPSTDIRPHPLIVADKWGFDLAYVDQDGDPDNYLYAGLDWFRGLGGERKGWSRTKNELSLSTRQLPYIAKDGKTYKIDFLLADDLYLVAMEMRVTKKRPQLVEIRDYLAKAGVLVDRIRRDPERAIVRLEGVVSRKAFTQALMQSLRDPSGYAMAVATDEAYLGLFDRNYQSLCEVLHTKMPRDKMDILGLQYLRIAEEICARRFEDRHEIELTKAQLIIREVTDVIGAQVRQTENLLRIDAVTGQRLLGGVDAIRGA